MAFDAPMAFDSVVELGGKTATGLPVPDDVVAALGGGKRPPVQVRVGGHTYRSTVAPMGGRYFVPLSAEHRVAAGLSAGDAVRVELTLDTQPRTVEVPADLRAALDAEPAAASYFDGLAFSHRKEWVRWVEEAKREQTRLDRIERTVATLREGRPVR